MESVIKSPDSRWVLKQQDEEAVKHIAREIKRIMSQGDRNEYSDDNCNVIARLLYNRGIRSDELIRDFFTLDISHMHSPALLPDIDKACERIKIACEKKEKITIYGDYDVDGITSVSILYKYLRGLDCDVDYYIPARTEEGYGLNENAIEKIKESGTSLIITVDTGTTAIDEVLFARSIGIDVVITDHHECKFAVDENGNMQEQVPDCIAVVNPKRPSGCYPFSDLAGVGVVFKLLCALTGDVDLMIEKYGGLTAIGTIADIMPIIDENRILVISGLNKLHQNIPIGIKALLDASGTDPYITSSVIAYQISPRLNAAGRIGDTKDSISLILSEDKAQAAELALRLCDENRRRQALEQKILCDVEGMIAEQGLEDKIFVFSSSDWHHGVIGIVASRITEKYNRPCVLICDEGDSMKGSARSIHGVNIFELLTHVSDSLQKFGGHEMAAGLTFKKENYEKLRNDLISYANANITDEMLLPVINAECELAFKDLSLRTCNYLKLLEPFGTGNPSPMFIVRNVIFTQVDPVSGNKHMKMRVTDGLTEVSAISFNTNPYLVNCCESDKADILCTINESDYKGKKMLSVNVHDIKIDKAITEECNAAHDAYNAFYETGVADKSILIDREDVVAVFKYIRKQFSADVHTYNGYSLCRRVSLDSGKQINYAQVRLSLDVLSDVGILSYTSSSNNIIDINVNNVYTKAELSKSPLWAVVKRNKS